MSHSTSDLLDICLERVEAGIPIDEAVAPFPEQAAELRELLVVAQNAMPRSIRVPASAQVNSRKRLLAQVQQLQQQRGAVHWWGLLHFLRANLGSLSFGAAILLLFLLAVGSVRALPGDSLYAVKLAAEQASVSLPGSSAERDQRAISYENLRTEEVAQMIQLKRTGQVNFGGFLQSEPNNQGWQIDGIPLQLAQPLKAQAAELANARVEIKGFLSTQGVVHVDTIAPRLDTLQGTLTRVEAGSWFIGSQEVRVTSITQVSGTPHPGSQVSAQVTGLKDTSAVLAIRAEVTEEKEVPTATTASTPAPQPVNGQNLQATSEPQEPPTPTATAAHNNKSRPIIQPAGSATATPNASNNNSSGDGSKSSPSQPQPTDDHHNGDSSSGSGDNSGGGDSNGSGEGGH